MRGPALGTRGTPCLPPAVLYRVGWRSSHPVHICPQLVTPHSSCDCCQAVDQPHVLCLVLISSINPNESEPAQACRHTQRHQPSTNRPPTLLPVPPLGAGRRVEPWSCGFPYSSNLYTFPIASQDLMGVCALIFKSSF